MLHIIGIIISLYLSILLFTKAVKSAADWLLACWLTVIFLHLFTYWLLVTEKFHEFPYLLGLEIGMPFIHGPFLYLYTALSIGKKISRLNFILHFMPALLVYVLLSKFFLLSGAQKILVYENQGAGYTFILKIIHLGVIPSGVAYILFSLFLVKKTLKDISDQLSEMGKISLAWLNHLIIGMGIIWLAVIFGTDITTFASVDLFILYIGYYGVKKAGIFADKIQTPLHQNTDLLLPIKYQKSALGEQLLSAIHVQLSTLMEQEKPYKDPDLSLNALAIQLNIHSNSLSQVINTMEQKNFYDYINQLRVNEFKRIVGAAANQKFTLLALAYEVGFNSKTSFNRNFKKITGLSPSTYLKAKNRNLIQK